jgi:hypothetical protein
MTGDGHDGAAHLTAAEAGAPVLLGLWAWMACANARGHHAARVAFRVVHVIITLGVIAETDPAGIAVYGIGAAIAGAISIQVQLAAMALLFCPAKTPLPYRPHRQLDPAQRQRPARRR